MDYAALSPHLGGWALRDHHIGDSSLRGGAINWGNLGSRITSALNSTGRWLYNTGNRFVHSNTFNQIKQGIQDSGVIRNVANLAGETLGALTDIGRLKLQQDLEKLRRKALGEEGPATQAELQALIQALQAQVAAGEPPAAPAAPAPAPPLVPTTRPIPEMVTEVKPPVTSSAPAVPVDVPTTLEMRPPPPKRRRKRARPGQWRARLDSLSGTGVATATRRMCY
ncbi:pVI [Fowl aviadenovirus A]|uniref:Pre-protein VI n=2 Tax=Fowl aviadenovirus A TaxID=190061 RepID=CAP6_ADEG1|nr:minor capsid protein precursor [Fowl aviadenovirus A]AP_000417.1 pVI [Fowl aviadenovirus A]Q64757.1 RecName: Full=Pre-protein VI; Short=pVI; Contains: RecName: Full=Endosome lysis protein; Contains: RecName: Full=Protease cofactor; AltName: Full=pVI-C; Flags: Precursor [Fowl aviadenovirus 1]AAC54911.1 L3 pVI [Fowl aviadenovirus 1]APP94063.1 minor capsid protein precursor [Fowl aviadenovirus A]ASU56019.1 L3 pVI [Fowl aviadenovirus A]AZI71482.1 L3 pVI [Fowl aviadenovirus A]QGQ62263.1 L3 pVI